MQKNAQNGLKTYFCDGSFMRLVRKFRPQWLQKVIAFAKTINSLNQSNLFKLPYVFGILLFIVIIMTFCRAVH